MIRIIIEVLFTFFFGFGLGFVYGGSYAFRIAKRDAEQILDGTHPMIKPERPDDENNSD